MYHPRQLDAFEGTFEWIFDEEATPFVDWARKNNDSNIFWITGKAGSGKSTLMNFLVDHSYTQSLLQHWAGEDTNQVLIANFFFWNASTSKMQKSQLGLMRALLYQLVESCGDEGLEEVAQHRETVDDSAWRRPWRQRELSATLESLVHRLSSTGSARRLCIFVDGLDEYELDNPEEGNYDDLILYLNTIARSPSVKLCVSSRPWNIFEQAYAGRPNIKMQDLNANDMARFVRTRLSEVPFMSSEKIPQLADMIQDAAQGVFLWVQLAVKHVRRGIIDRDDIVVLKQRIEDLPTELDEFMERIFRSIERVHEQFAATVLLLTLEDPHSSNSGMYDLLQYSFLEELAGSQRKSAVQTCRLTREQAINRVQHAQFSINKWCKDLLEVNAAQALEGTAYRFGYDLGRATIGFPHRTIADFVRSKARSGVLHEMAGENFSVVSEKWNLILLMLKSAPDDESMRKCAEQAFLFLEKAFRWRDSSYVQFFDEADAACRDQLTPSTGAHWSATMDIYSKGLLPVTPDGYSPLSLALQQRLTRYASDVLSDKNRAYTPQQLHYALALLLVGTGPHRHFGEYPDNSAVDQIFRRRSDWTLNNQEVRWRARIYSAWQLFLLTLASTAKIALQDDYEYSNVKCLVELFLLNDADPGARIHRSDMAVETSKELQHLAGDDDNLRASQVFGLLHTIHANRSLPQDQHGASRYLQLKVALESAAHKKGPRTRELLISEQKGKRWPSRLRAVFDRRQESS